MLRYTTPQTIERFKLVHGNKYDYTKFTYLGSHVKSIIICSEHGEFNQTPKEHLNGQGCTKCGYIKVSKDLNKGLNFYLNVCRKIHGEIYDYVDIIHNYKTLHTKYQIRCSKHGLFEQVLATHIHQKAGCPKCFGEKRHGFNLEKWAENSTGHIASLYLIRIYNNTESFLKIGITYETVERRFYKLKSVGYSYEILAQISIPDKGGRAIAIIETELHNACREFSYKPKTAFKGQGECYKLDKLQQILTMIQKEIDLMRYALCAIESLKDDCYEISGKYATQVNTRESAMSYTGSKTLNEFKS